MFVKEYIDKVQEIIEASALAPFLRDGCENGRYFVGGHRVYFSIEFEIGKESCDIRFKLDPNRDKKEVREGDGKSYVRLPYEIDEVGVKWNTLTMRTVEQASMAADFYVEVSKLAAKIQALNRSIYTVYDEYIQLHSPGEPSAEDRWAAEDDASGILPHAKKDKLVEEAEVRNLPSYGTKDAIRERLYEHAQEYGDAGKVETYNEWTQNRIQPLNKAS